MQAQPACLSVRSSVHRPGPYLQCKTPNAVGSSPFKKKSKINEKKRRKNFGKKSISPTEKTVCQNRREFHPLSLATEGIKKKYIYDRYIYKLNDDKKELQCYRSVKAFTFTLKIKKKPLVKLEKKKKNIKKIQRKKYRDKKIYL